MKRIGNLSESACSKLFSISQDSANANLILVELSTLLKIKSFKEKAKVKSIDSRDSFYITIDEDRLNARIIEKECPSQNFLFAEAPKEISALSLSKIREYQMFESGYVLPSTVKSHSCQKLEACPICDDGKCTVCHGDTKVECDACGGDTHCHSCGGSGEYPCHSCNETGECRHCDGTGEEDCDDCDGNGWVWVDCRACNGTGRYTLRNGYDVECRACRGSGHHHKEDCWTCNGTGSVDCHVCDGSGKCTKCGGEGHVECRACHGTGICGKCRGKGTLKCRNCKGTGLCPSCKGSQTISCRRCLGTGTYQTFSCITLSPDNHKFILKDKLLEKQLGVDLQSISKRQKYNGTPYVIDFTKPIINDSSLMDCLSMTSDLSYHDKMLEYRRSLINTDGSILIKPDIYVKSSILVEQFPIIKCSIEYSKEVFNFYIVGYDGKVFADKTPSIWDKICAFFIKI